MSPFRVDRLARVDEQITSLFLQAEKLGIQQIFVDRLGEMLTLVREQPLGWGDPIRNTVLDGGTVFRGIRQPLIVQYAAFEKERVVMLLDINPFPGYGFTEQT